MPYHEFFWTERALEKIAEHGLTVADVEYAVLKTRRSPRASRSSRLPTYTGRTPSGELILVVFERVDATQIMVITAYPIENGRGER
jgi:uncharacterized DUF497 family protein